MVAFSCSAAHVLAPLTACRRPTTPAEGLAFAGSLRATRAFDPYSSLHDALYAEKLSRLLPTYSLSPRVDDDLVLGAWLTGGVLVSVSSVRRICSLVAWMSAVQLAEITQRAGLSVPAATEAQVGAIAGSVTAVESAAGPAGARSRSFTLAGRRDLERFLVEHVIDIVEHRERYRALGVGFPAPIVLHGPPGCGKTFAVERLVEYLGWPSFEIQASTVASPYIHETSRKVAAVFEEAMKQSPAILVIDEMEAFLADRQFGAAASHHRVEEVAEFLRRIPEAVKNDVLVIAMTNRVDMIDPAILRRGRFDHVVKVEMASQAEVLALLEKLVGELPAEPGLSMVGLAERLTGRPLSDVAFVVREGARLAARAGKTRLDAASLREALEACSVRDTGSGSRGKIGFLRSRAATD